MKPPTKSDTERGAVAPATTCSAGSDTPETDAEITHVTEEDGTSSCFPWVRMDFARRLERERNEARADVHRLIEVFRRNIIGKHPTLECIAAVYEPNDQAHPRPKNPN